MLRTATRPRWLGLLVLALLVAAAAIQLGRWQWSVAHDKARADAVREVQERPVRPIGEVIAPHESFPADGSGQRVTAKGEYAQEGGFVVVDRLLDGRRGRWAVDRFVVAGTGANLPVVRGWVPDGAEAPTPPRGQVELVGSLAPGEAPDTGSLPDGEATTIDLGQLVNDWPGELYTAFAFVLEEQSAGRQVAAAGLERVPPPLPDTSFDLRNGSYAAQWWVVAAFALWMWWRMVRQAAREEREERSGRAPPGTADPAAGDPPSPDPIDTDHQGQP